jgi:hypothetical protein
MKKVKILSHPTQIQTIQLDEYDYNSGEVEDKLTRMQIRKWRKLRHEIA